jgi:hypothetical protein
MKTLYIVDALRQRATTSTSLLWEPAIWYPLVYAEIMTKLMSEDQRKQVSKIAKRMKRGKP